MNPIVVWFRKDLRWVDNPPLHWACTQIAPVVPVYIWLPEEVREWPTGRANRYGLHQALAGLDASLRGV